MRSDLAKLFKLPEESIAQDCTKYNGEYVTELPSHFRLKVSMELDPKWEALQYLLEE